MRPVYILNDQQEKIKNAAIHWFLYESEQLFQIDGEAGTGKSLLIYEILRQLGLEDNQFLAMAYTGQASIVMRTKGFPFAKSIHSSLYEVVEEKSDGGDKLAEAFGVATKKKKFVLKRFIDPAIRLFFIDEAYMVPDYMVKDIMSFGIKVIVAGDAHQLPPVKADPAFLVSGTVHHLTQLMRQSETNPIIYLAHRAMNGEPIHTGVYGNDVLVINEDEFIPEMVGYSQCIICGTNKTRENANQYVRALAGFHGSIPHYGERIICRKNDWDLCVNGIALANGLSGTVVSITDAGCFTKDKSQFTIDFKPDLTDSVFYGVPVNYKYFISPVEAKNEMKSNFAVAKWQAGEYFDFAYGLTTHLAQGSEYNTGIYVEEYMRYEIQKQLNYTGITRFKQKMIYIKKSKSNFFQI